MQAEGTAAPRWSPILEEQLVALGCFRDGVFSMTNKPLALHAGARSGWRASEV